VVDSPTLGYPRRRLIARCLEARPRLVRVGARPGWGKSSFARQLASAVGSYAVCECTGVTSLADFEQRLDAARASDPAALVVDSAEQLVHVPGAAEAILRMVEASAPGKMTVVTTRADIGIGPNRTIAPHESLTISATDLAFDLAEVREIFAGIGIDDTTLARVMALSRGWAIAVFFFARLAREGLLFDAFANMSGPLLSDLYRYIERETLSTWDALDRATAAALVVIPDATDAELEAVIGTEGVQALEAWVARGGPFVRTDDRFAITELARHAVPHFLSRELAEMRERATQSAIASGSRMRAAEIFIAAGDHERAAAELEILGAPESVAALSPQYAALAARLKPEILLRSRNALVGVLASRETHSNPQPFFAIAQTCYEQLEPGNDAELVAGTRTAYGVMLRAVARLGEARRILEEAIELGDPSTERTAMVEAALGSLDAIQGNLRAAEEHFARAGVPPSGPTRFPVERLELEVMHNNLSGDRKRVQKASQRNVEEARPWGDNATITALRYLTAGAWLAGDDAAVASSIEEANRIINTGVPIYLRAAAIRPRLGEPVGWYDRWICLWYMNSALLEEDAETARRFMEVALVGYSHVGSLFWTAVSSIAATAIPGMPVDDLKARAREAAASLGDARLTAAVEAAAEERTDETDILAPLQQRMAHSRAMRRSLLKVSVLTGQVVAGDETLAIRERELELLIALAVERRPLTPDALVARLWPALEADEATAALRTAIYRLRKQLRNPEAIVSTASGYRLAETIPVDSHEAPRFFTGIRRFGDLNDRDRARLNDLFETLAHGLPSIYLRWEWFAPYVTRFHDLLHDIGTFLAEDDLRRGDTEAAIEHAERLLQGDALDEPANEIAIKAHLAAGRKSEALRRFRRYRDALEREYGTTPSTDLTTLLAST
jgi:DNA-binding SARP family transcriptional activator